MSVIGPENSLNDNRKHTQTEVAWIIGEHWENFVGYGRVATFIVK